MRLSVYCFGSALGFPDEVLINGRWAFALQKRAASTRIHVSEEVDWVSPESIYCIEPIGRSKKRNDLPREITVGLVLSDLQPTLPGFEQEVANQEAPRKRFVRYFDRLYAPDFRTSDPALIESLYDYLAAHYDESISVELNASVWRQLFLTAGIPEDIKRRSLETLRVLDFGVGTGYTTQQAMHDLYGDAGASDLPFELYGCDLSSKMIQICRSKRVRLFFQGSSGIRKAFYAPRGLAFPNAFFDAIIACFVEHHFPEPPTYDIPFGEMRRVLRPRGVLAFSLFKRRTNWLEGTDGMLMRLGFESIEYRVQEFHTDGMRRLIPLVFAHRAGGAEERPLDCGGIFAQTPCEPAQSALGRSRIPQTSGNQEELEGENESVDGGSSAGLRS